MCQRLETGAEIGVRDTYLATVCSLYNINNTVLSSRVFRLPRYVFNERVLCSAVYVCMYVSKYRERDTASLTLTAGCLTDRSPTVRLTEAHTPPPARVGCVALDD